MQQPILIDTDVMVDFLRGNPTAVALIQKDSKRIVLPSIVVAELYAGRRQTCRSKGAAKKIIDTVIYQCNLCGENGDEL